MNAIARNITWRAVFISGFIAGSVFLLVSVLLAPRILGVDAQLMLRYFAALVMGNPVLVENSSTVLVVGVLVHYLLSLIFTLVIAIVVHRWGLGVGLVGGAILGLAIYGFNLYTLTLFVPWFFAINSAVIMFSHVVFGAVAGGVYELFDHYDQPLETAREA